MKGTITTTMFTTGAALVILAIYYLIAGNKYMDVQTIIQIFGANILINFGLLLRYKFEIKNVILDYIIDVCYITAVLLVFGIIFDWYSMVPAWLLVAMAIVIYAFVIITTVAKINKDTKEINDLLQRRKDKDNYIA